MLVFRIKVYLDHLGVLNRAAQASYAGVAPRSESPHRPGEDAVHAGPAQCNFRVSAIADQPFEQVHGQATLADFHPCAIRERRDFGRGARLKVVAVIHVESLIQSNKLRHVARCRDHQPLRNPLS
jgi:hypothetical protein